MKTTDILGGMSPRRAIVTLALPSTLALIAKAVYNIVDTAYIGMLDSSISLAAVGVTLPILLIMVSLENIFAAGAAVVEGHQLGAKDMEGASRTVSTIVYFSLCVGAAVCVLGIIFIEPLLRSFGASDAVLPEAKAYAFWMFIAALFNLPAQSMNCACRAESSARISSVAVITGALLNVVLDPIFMFSWGLGLGVGGASLATTVSQAVTFIILCVFFFGGHSRVKIRLRSFHLGGGFVLGVVKIGIPSAVIQLCLALATSLTNVMAKGLPDADQIIAAYGVVQRLVLIACYMIMGFMQGYQPVAAYAFGAGDRDRLRASMRFALLGSVVIALVLAALYIGFSGPLIRLFNRSPEVVAYGRAFIFSQMILYPAFGICYMMTITFQAIGASRYGFFLSLVRQGLFFIPFILTLPRYWGFKGLCAAQPCADLTTLLLCLLSVPAMKKIADKNIPGKEKPEASD